MRTPTTTGRSKNGGGKGAAPPPPPPPDEPQGPEDFLDSEPLDLVIQAMDILRHSSGAPREIMVGLFQRLDALYQQMTATADPGLLTPLAKLTGDLKQASRTLGQSEARFLVDAYYSMQENRIRSAHQVRTLAEPKKTATETGKEFWTAEPHDVLEWLYGQEEHLEKQIRSALDYYSGSHTAGVWARSNKGIGPVIAAGLLANIDITKAPTVGHIWRFAGLDPTNKWLGTAKATDLVDKVLSDDGSGKRRRGAEVSEDQFLRMCAAVNSSPERIRLRLVDRETSEVDMSRAAVIKGLAKRPWNASLKRLCFLIGDSFVKVSNRPDDFYGKLYKSRKDWETARNQQHLYAEQARTSLEEKRFSPNTDAFKWYSQGMLPPARIHLRAQRRAVKLFLAHFHEVLYWTTYQRLPPFPYVLENVPGHAHRLEVPNLELVPELAEAKARAQYPQGRRA